MRLLIRASILFQIPSHTAFCFSIAITRPNLSMQAFYKYRLAYQGFLLPTIVTIASVNSSLSDRILCAHCSFSDWVIRNSFSFLLQAKRLLISSFTSVSPMALEVVVWDCAVQTGLREDSGRRPIDERGLTGILGVVLSGSVQETSWLDLSLLICLETSLELAILGRLDWSFLILAASDLAVAEREEVCCILIINFIRHGQEGSSQYYIYQCSYRGRKARRPPSRKSPSLPDPIKTSTNSTSIEAAKSQSPPISTMATSPSLSKSRNSTLEAVSDFKNKSSTPRKTWFYFWASAPKGFRLRFTLENVSIYESMYEDSNWARPVFKDERGFWLTIKDAFLTYRDQVGIVFDHTFATESPVYFALTIPFSYEDNESYLRDLAYRIPDHIAYQDETVATTSQGLNVHKLTLTHKETTNIQTKPLVLITCRVHPGEVGSTFCLIGIIDFLTRPFSLQAHILLKMYEFVIYPMVNPDGVHAGNYRMDLLNNNLNRFYNDPSPQQHPCVYDIRTFICNMLRDAPARRFMFHFDLHSHSALKPAFIYGNAFEDIVTQTESTLYCKLLEQNCETFRYGLSQFTQRHMKMKDKGQNMTKQGCSRVVLSKLAGITYSFTMQTSIFPYSNKQPLAPPNNTTFMRNQNSFYDNVDKQSFLGRFNTRSDMVIDNMLIGYGMMTTILDIFEKNPYTRINSLEESLENYRKQISQNMLQNEERFKMLDTKAYQKARMIGKMIKEEFNSKYQRGWNYLITDPSFVGIKWPTCFKWFEPLEAKKQKKDRRIKTEAAESQKQINDFLHPKNARRNLFSYDEPSPYPEREESPVRKIMSPRNNVVNLELPTPEQHALPEIRKSIQRNSFGGQNKSIIGSASGKKKASQQFYQVKQKDDDSIKPFPSLEIKQIHHLAERDSSKNIVLSFIQQQIEKMSKAKCNQHKNMVVNHRLGNQRVLKKNSSKSLKVLLAPHRNIPQSSSVNKKIQITQTCEDIVQRRKIDMQEQLKLEQNAESQKQCRVKEILNFEGKSQRNMGNKREIAKIKYSELKKKNFIRQENSNFKLPELKMLLTPYRGPKLEVDGRAVTTPDQC